MTDKILSMNMRPLVIENGDNAAEKWKQWKQRFEIFMDANEINNFPIAKQTAILLNVIGDEALKIFNSFNIDRKQTKVEDILKKFDEKFSPHSNVTVERYNFFTRMQRQDETLEEYLTVLTNLSTACKFETLQDSLIKDMLVIGIQNTHIKERLLQEENLTVENAMKIAKSLELSQERSTKLMGKTENGEKVQAIKTNNRSRSQTRYNNKVNYNRNRSSSSSRHNFNQRQKSPANNICRRCGQAHRYKCPAEGITCKNCKKKNHFAKFCFFKNSGNYNKSGNNSNNNHRVSTIQTLSNPQDNHFIIGAINKNGNNVDDWQIYVYCHNLKIKCQIDTGADTNVISKHTLERIKCSSQENIKVFKTNNKIYTFSGELVPNLGTCIINCEFETGSSARLYFTVVECECIPIIGWKTCEKLGIVKRIFKIDDKLSNRSVQNIVSKYANTFEGLGCLPYKAHIDIDSSVTPKVCPVRRIPYSLEKRLKEELEYMEELQVIEKVDKPTKWVNSIVLVEKPNGKLRICLDPRNLNVAIKRPHYPYPTFDDLRSKIAGASIFSKLDASSGYWTICLDEESSELCTFNTPYGRYKFLRLPYGINSSGEIFHRTMNQLFGDLPGITIFVDDILVYGSTIEEHNERLKSLFKRASEVNLKFNKAKCQFGMSEICYVGHIFNKEGVSPDQSKIEAIFKMPSPSNVKELQRFLGMINYLGSYIPNLAEENSLLRELLKKHNQWQWLDQHESQFKKLKSMLCQSPVLVHYDMKKPIRLSVDSSQHAVGAVILHDKNPIAYASKSLNKSQINYAQIEKELYAIVFGCKKFHQYLYGKQIQVETDHQPLVTLFKKPLSEVPARLQRMMITLQAYNLVVSYTKGSEMYISDTLSRAPVKDDNFSQELVSLEDLDSNINIHINLLTSNLAISPEKLEKITSHTKQDIVSQKLIEYYRKGWPKCKEHCHSLTLPYWNIKEEIHVINDIIFKNNSVIIPRSMRTEILNILHEGHQGIEKTKNLARGVVYWPNINQDIENKIRQCETCSIYSANKSKQPMLTQEQPLFPWQKVATDLFEYEGKKYLLAVDYYSNYIEIANLNKDSRTSNVIAHLKSIFARHGIPMQLVSDGGPPYNSIEFKKFLHEWDIEHVVSSPYLPRSNGLAEVSVKIIKNILRKSDDSGSDPYLGLLQYRNTPRGNLNSPAQLLMSRTLRSQLPNKISHLKPKIVKHSEHYKKKQEKIQKTKVYYDKNCKKYPEFHINDQIYFKKNPNDIIWTEGTIVSKTKYPRSFIVKDCNNTTYRRNSQHIRFKYKSISQTSSQKNVSQKSNKKVNFRDSPSPSQLNQKRNKSNFLKEEDDSYSFIFTYHESSPKSSLQSHELSNDSDSFISIESSHSCQSEKQAQNIMKTKSPIPVNVDDSFQSESQSENIVKSPIFVNVEETIVSPESLHDYNEYDTTSSVCKNLENLLQSPSDLIVSSSEEQSPLPCNDDAAERQYSSRGRLLKKTLRLDL